MLFGSAARGNGDELVRYIELSVYSAG
jgi:predicted nucleotidyltransferase